MKANDIRRGVVIMYNKIPHRVLEFHHHTPGNLRAMVQTKLRNLLNGTQTEVRFSSTEEVERADVMTSPASYLYSDNEGFHFLNSENYEQFAIPTEILGDGVYYLQDEMQVTVTFYEGQPIGIELPTTVVLTVVETEPELRGATASNSPKPAKMDTGLSVTVPPFIKVGDKIVVNTEEGKYISRAE
ncbi:MAG: elongation factor P [Deltaproteobacteria bacterium]|nr:elongation factor P [Deltaproteobacteria bacterium]